MNPWFATQQAERTAENIDLFSVKSVFQLFWEDK